MGTMSLHDSPLLNDSYLTESPCKEWLLLTNTAEEYMSLAVTLSSLPKPWLEWVESIVVGREKRGTRIQYPIAYRIATLWNGIILLQEAKFICDFVENALRKIILIHCYKENIAIIEIYKTIPCSKKLIKKFEIDQKIKLSLFELFPENILTTFSFYQSSEAIFRNWSGVCCNDRTKRGFSKIFWHEKSCRDPNLFKKNMDEIRKNRNKIAHSKQLFQQHEIQHIYEIANRWLVPLNIGMHSRVLRYRKDRPRFLEAIAF